jgi:hypothetical protein
VLAAVGGPEAALALLAQVVDIDRAGRILPSCTRAAGYDRDPLAQTAYASRGRPLDADILQSRFDSCAAPCLGNCLHFGRFFHRLGYQLVQRGALPRHTPTKQMAYERTEASCLTGGGATVNGKAVL